MQYNYDDDDDDDGVSGQERLELQINSGVRPVLEDVDELRILLGSDSVKCPTPRAEIRLRCGDIALIPLQLLCKVIINSNNNDDTSSSSIIVTLTIIFPKIGFPSDMPLDVVISCDSDIDTNINDEIFQSLKEFCNEKSANDDYPRSRAVLEKMKQLFHSKYFHDCVGTESSNDADIDNNDNEDVNMNTYATCMICRHHIFNMTDIEEHNPSNKGFKRNCNPTTTTCTSFFLKDPKDWMTGLSDNNGKILCPNPKCNAKLGQWCWTGSQCSCGLWITPSFQINKNKIDVKNDRNIFSFT